MSTPIRRYPDLVCHRALLDELEAADDPLPEVLPDLAVHVSARERDAADVEYAADAICLAWLLDKTLFDRGWEAPVGGEIIGLIGSGRSRASATPTKASSLHGCWAATITS